MRVALVNDLRLAVEALRRVVRTIPGVEIAWIATDGQQAVQKCREDCPDLILMDLVMPVMNGAEATRRIMGSTPCPILVTTATITGNCDLVYDALGAGAIDAVETPALGLDGQLTGAHPLIRKMACVMKVAQHHRSECPSVVAPPVVAPSPVDSVRATLPRFLAIGASTGGPLAICTVLKGLRQPASYAIVIVQHLDVGFVPGMGNWLSSETGWPVSLIDSGMTPSGGSAYLAHSCDHLIVDSAGRFQYAPEPKDALHRPSIDVLFSSLANPSIEPGVAVLLTGMGRDGADGLKLLHDANWITIAQDKQSSVVWGMPAAAVRQNAASYVLPLDQISHQIDDAVMSFEPCDG